MGAIFTLLARGIRFGEGLPPWVGVLLIALLLVAVAAPAIRASRRPRQGPLWSPAHAPARAEQQDPVERAREHLRVRHHLRALLTPEETCGLWELPNGVYGFTLMPGSTHSPVLRTQGLDLFEVHKIEDGSVVVLGFVSSETAGLLGASGKRIKVALCSSPQPGATELVSVPLARVVCGKQRVSRKGSVMELEIAPARAG